VLVTGYIAGAEWGAIACRRVCRLQVKNKIATLARWLDKKIFVKGL